MGKLQDLVQDLAALKEHLNAKLLMHLHMEHAYVAPHADIHYLWLHKKQGYWSAFSVRSRGKQKAWIFSTVVIFSHSLTRSLS